MRKLLMCVLALGLLSSEALAQSSTSSTTTTTTSDGTVQQTRYSERDDSEGPRFNLGLDVIGVLPIGDFNDVAGVGLGGLLRAEFLVYEGIGITARGGYIYHFEETLEGIGEGGGDVDTNASEIPLLAGIKLGLGTGIYAAVEAGVVNLNFGDEVDLDDEWNPAGTVGLGFHLGAADLRFGLHSLDLGNIGDSLELALSVGFNFI